MRLPKFLKNLLAAFAFGIPGFARGKDEASGRDLREVKPVERPWRHLIPGGTLEKVSHYGRTIAGGPGSQKIGDAFDALPPRIRDEMLAAREGMIRQLRPGEREDSGAELPGIHRRHGTDAIAHALATRYTRDKSGRLQPREDMDERVDHDTRRRQAGLEKDD